MYTLFFPGYAADDDGNFVPIIGFDCRGLEPIHWHPEVDSSGMYFMYVHLLGRLLELLDLDVPVMDEFMKNSTVWFN